MMVLGLSKLRPLEGFVTVPSNRGNQPQEHQNLVETTSSQLDLPMPCSENFLDSGVGGREKLDAEAISSPPPRPHVRITSTIRDEEDKSNESQAQHLRYKRFTGTASAKAEASLFFVISLVVIVLLVISRLLIYVILVGIDNRSHAANVLVLLACFKITIELQHPPSNDASPVTHSPFLHRDNIPTAEATILPDEEPNAELVEDGFTYYDYP